MNGEHTEAGELDTAHIEASEAVSATVRMVEAILFASAEPVSEAMLLQRLPYDVDLKPIMQTLKTEYQLRGVNLIRVGDSWAFRTAPDLAFLMSHDQVKQKKLSRAASEVLAIIAYHQPVTRAEIEDIRGVEASKGTLDVLMEAGWVRMRGRRRSPGRPVTYGTTNGFLDHFGLSDIKDLPGMEELRGAGLLSSRLPSNFSVPVPFSGTDELTEDEDPFSISDIEELGLFPPKADSD